MERLYATVLGIDPASLANLAKVAFGVLLWIVLVIVNRGAAAPSAAGIPPVRTPRRRDGSHRPTPV